MLSKKYQSGNCDFTFLWKRNWTSGFTIIDILNQFHPNLIATIYFTNSFTKLVTLRDIQAEYPHLQNKDICLVDDREDQYQLCCDEGYTVFEADENDDHPEFMREFVDVQCEPKKKVDPTVYKYPV